MRGGIVKVKERDENEIGVKEDFFFQAGDGIRGAQGARGVGEVYKKQELSLLRNGQYESQ